VHTWGFSVVLVDDEPNEVFLLKRALQRIDPAVSVLVFGDGRQAIDYLAQAGADAKSGEFVPDRMLMFLDLKMPRMTGFEVLDWKRQQPELSRMIVMVMSNSEQANDNARAYELGCNGYLVKPWDLERLTEMVRHVLRYWVESSNRAVYETAIQHSSTVGLQDLRATRGISPERRS
jgi:CheY-like chemotaxis protein